jgi:PAS domain S-box-containing protein
MPRERILVVDDEPTVVRVCVEILSEHGYEVQGATSGTEGLALLETESFDLLVVDIKMPDMDGLTVLRRAKGLDPDLAAVVITGYAALDGAIEALHTGAQGFVLKPFGIDQFALAVREALAQRRKDQERMRLRAQLPILEIAQALMVEEDAPYTATRLLESIARELKADQASLLLLGTIPGDVYVAGTVGLPADVAGTKLIRGVDLVEESLMNDKPFVIESAQGLAPALRQLLIGPDVGPTVLVPLRTVKRAVGILSLARSTDAPPFTESELGLLFIIGGQVATAMENIRLFDAVARGKREWETTFDAITDGIFICDRDLRVVRVNWALARWLGTTPAALIGRDCREILSGDDAPQESWFVLGELERRRPETTEIQFPQIPGTFLLSVYPVIERDQVVQLVYVLKDISERKQREHWIQTQRDLGLALSASRGLETLRICLEVAIDVAGVDCGGLYLVDEDSGGDLVLAFSQGLPPGFVADASRFPADSSQTRFVQRREPVYSRHHELETNLSDARLEEGLRAIAVVPVHHQDRVIGCLNLASHTLDEIPEVVRPGIEAMAGQIGSAIVRYQVEEALKHERQFVSTVLDTVGALVVVLDHQGRIVRFNPACEQATGYAADEVIGRFVWDLFVVPEEVESVKEVFSNLREGVFPNENENYWLTGDGTRRLIAWSNTVLLDEEGAVGYVIATGIDVTERRKAEEEIRQRNRELVALNAIATTISQTLDLENILSETLKNTLEATGTDGGWVQLLDAEGDRLSPAVHVGVPAELLDAIGAVRPLDGLTAKVVQSGETVVADGGSLDALLGPTVQEEQGVRVVAGVPIKAKDQVVGVLCVLRMSPSQLGDQDVQLLSLIGHQIGVAVENVRLFEQLFTTHKRLRQLAQQIVSAQEEERRRVSRELHDEAGQALTALRIGLQLMRADLSESDALHERLDEAITLTETTMQRIRLLAQDLRPPALEAVGLGPTLEGFCRDFAERTGLQIGFRGVDLPTLPDEISICLYRFLQEALTNVVRHAEAGRVQVSLDRDSETLNLSVEDDGRGFYEDWGSAGQPVGMGLLGMQERLELLGGWLEIASHPDEGTRLVAHIPWEQDK